MLALQEPYFNELTQKTYCPKGFTLAMEHNAQTRVCFGISKEIPLGDWSFKATSAFVASLQLRTDCGMITIINIYNPRDTANTIRTWTDAETAIARAQTEGDVLLLGDFNAHHRTWGGQEAADEPQSNHLLCETRRRGLDLLTPRGIATFKRANCQTVIDLTFVSRALRDRVMFCSPVDQWAITADHLPIQIHLQTGINPQSIRRKYAVDKIDKSKFIQHVKQSEWATAQHPITALHDAIQSGLTYYCPTTKPSPYSNPRWSPRATELLAGARQARRRYLATNEQQHRTAYRSFQNELQREMKRQSRADWRRFVHESVNMKAGQHNQGLWKLSKWSRQRAGKPPADTHLPGLRRQEQDRHTDKNDEKATILAEKFFPPTPEADLSDIADDAQLKRTLEIASTITPAQLATVVNRLPNKRAPGPDRIPNEILKILIPEILDQLAQVLSSLLASGTLPDSFRVSTTVVLRKERKPDYSLPSSYRPIALENTLAKLIEKILADRIADAAETHNILPWNQTGGRKKRSTLSALELLTSSIQTAWKARPGCVVSMLALDLGGAFDNVSHERLLHIIRTEGYPQWITQCVQSFLSNRKTKILFSGYESNWFHTQAGIPQGSPLSPILFLLFISELLATFQRPNGDTLALGFVDDTNLYTWGNSASENCKRLEAAHDRCVAWAKRHGARFAPDKYKLIHFRRRQPRNDTGDLASTVRIEGSHVKAETSLRVLGVQVDPKLQWHDHIKKAREKGNSAFKALSRITASTWGPSTRRARLVYSAVVRPTALYGAQVWAIKDDGGPATARMLKPFESLQNKSLKRALGAYKRTPTIAVERESETRSIRIQIDTLAQQRAIDTIDHQATKDIARATNQIWNSLRSESPFSHRRRGAPPTRQRAATPIERLRARAQRTARDTPPRLVKGVVQPEPPRKTIERAAKEAQRARWEQKARNGTATTWKTPWKTQPLKLYDNLPKHEATALLLLRTEIIGLNGWLASINVPGIDRRCSCGWTEQSVRHVLIHCPDQRESRDRYLLPGVTDLNEMLTRPASAHCAARWLVNCGLLPQFTVANEIDKENVAAYQTFRALHEWED